MLAGDANTFYAFEVKASGQNAIYIGGEGVESLIYFAQNFGAKARIAVRFDRHDWAFFHPSELQQTDGGSYRVKEQKAVEQGTELSEL